MSGPAAASVLLGYQPRDVANAPHIKARIQARSAARADSPDIAAWLSNHFYRHVVGNVQAPPPAVQPLHSQQDLRTQMGVHSPDWALQRLPALPPETPEPATLWWVDPDSRYVLQQEERLLEFLGSRNGTSLEGKLQRINAPQALARWTLEHLAFEKRKAAGHLDHQPTAIQAVLRTPNGVFVEFRPDSPALRAEMAFESQEMGHCVGQFADRKSLRGGYGERYANACHKGQMRLFSFRTGQGQPRITINAFVQANGQLQIEQIKGKQNRPPIARYQADVLQLLNHLPLDDYLPHDAQAMGLVRLPDHLLPPTAPLAAWKTVSQLHSESEQLWLMQQHPEYLQQLPPLQPLAQWMALARNEGQALKALDKHALTAAVHATLAFTRQRSGVSSTPPGTAA